MTLPRWVLWALLALAPLLLVLGAFVLGFLSEPSAVGRMRAALYVIGVGAIAGGLAGGAGGVWMLVKRRT